MLFKKLKETPFFIIGPCVIENRDITLRLAASLKKLFTKFPFTFIFKASFDKANRTSIDAFRGPGMEKGLRILEEVKKELDLYTTTDIHLPQQAEPVAQVVDILQIPAFLCRQTDILLASAKTKKIINIKKGQFLSGKDMKYPLEKVLKSNNSNILLTERGNSFGYNELVIDFRNLIDMQAFQVPVILDITHSCQKPGGKGSKSGGDSRYAPYMGFAAASIGIRGFFLETHFEPEKALSDGPNMIAFAELEGFIKKMCPFLNVE